MNWPPAACVSEDTRPVTVPEVATGYINCMNQECLHRAKGGDLAALAEQHGAHLPVAELVKRAVCS